MDIHSKAATLLSRTIRYVQQVERGERHRSEHASKIQHHTLTKIRGFRPLRKNEIVCIMVGRNEMLRLPDALRHYRALGVDRFAFIENLSDDGTREYLLDQPDVDVWATGNSYAEARSAVYWFERVGISYGWGSWQVLVDPDELLVYDGMDRFDLHDLAGKLTEHRSIAMTAPLVDMYSDQPLNGVQYNAGESMIECCRYFDTNYQWHVNRQGHQYLTGGPRRRLLSRDGDIFRHSLMKHPFYKLDRRLVRGSIHQLEPVPHRRAPRGALLHFKFLSDFSDRVQQAVEFGQHYNGSVEYKRYAEGLEDGSLTTMMYPGSKRLDTLQDLFDLQIATPLQWRTQKAGKVVLPVFSAAANRLTGLAQQ